jgi:endonuclease/exonuclease/phosphatase (EEP) superfamily protein YafD
LCAAILAAVLMGLGRYAEGAAALGSAAFCAVTVLGVRRLPKAGEESGQRGIAADVDGTDPSKILSVLTCNIWLLNRGYEKLSKLIGSKDPDVVVLLETDHQWFSAMKRALAHYQHHKAEARDDYFGLAVFSKYPMIATVERLHSEAKPSMRCVIRHPSGDLTLWCLHPEPPYLPAAAIRHRLELEVLAGRIHNEAHPAIVTGDLNTAPWARAFRASFGILRNSASGFGLAATWPASLPNFLRIPIDHTLHTEHFKTLFHEVLPHVGSDHRPILVRLMRRSIK